jgi:hypothetical protein
MQPNRRRILESRWLTALYRQALIQLTMTAIDGDDRQALRATELLCDRTEVKVR